MHGFSEGELHGHVEQFIDRASAGFLGHQGTRTKADYLEAITLKAGRNRDRWFDDHLARIAKRDAADIADLPLACG